MAPGSLGRALDPRVELLCFTLVFFLPNQPQAGLFSFLYLSFSVKVALHSCSSLEGIRPNETTQSELAQI